MSLEMRFGRCVVDENGCTVASIDDGRVAESRDGICSMLIGILCTLMFAFACAGLIVPSAYAANAGLQAAGPQATNYDTSWYDGKESPYVITNVKQLKGLAYLVNSGTDDFEGDEVKLAPQSGRLVFAEGMSIEPIGDANHPFQGVFDGGNAPISNPVLDIGGRLANVGLFGYAGDKAVVKNLQLHGSEDYPLTVTNSTKGKKIQNVGAIAGFLGGSIENCSSSVIIQVVNNGAVPQKKGDKPEDQCIILGIGGLVGTLLGDMRDCRHASDTQLLVSSSSNVSTDVPYIAGYVGGLVGLQGDVNHPENVTALERCTNEGPLTFNVSGSGGVDRFGSQIYSSSSMVGGIVGYTMGSVSDCSNAAEVHTGIVKNGKTKAGWGASNTGGIVGSLRGPVIANPASASGVVGANETDPGYTVWQNSKGAKEADTLSITNCSNTADVTGLASVAGICGSSGAFTEVIGCSNTGKIEGTRWNKPCPSGIVGISNGDIRYCYNQGRCFSTTGGGYYAAGITALLTTYNTSVTKDEMKLDLPELCGCYVTGTIGGEEAGYRTGVLAGESDGHIHDNCVLPDLTVDKAMAESGFDDGKSHSRLVAKDMNRGTLTNNHELSADAMRTSEAVSYLNKPNAKRSDWSLYYVVVPGGYPVLSWQTTGMDLGTPVSLDSVATGVGEVIDPEYSAAYAPVPSVKLNTVSESITLYQDADYKVVVEDGAREVGGAYEATIVGINGYTGELGGKAGYTIKKADIGNCTVTATPAVFNWERQAPSSVTVTDEVGNVVDPSEYTFETLPNEDGSTKQVNGKYYDYINCHSASYRYDVKVTANDLSEKYVGSTTQPAFQIKWASLFYSATEVTDNPNLEESAKLGDIVWGNKSWDIKKALKEKGFVKIKYTGSEIKPKCASVTYLGRNMRDGTGNKDTGYHPLNYDYKYVYGNPNPETGKDADGSCVNVTGSDERKLACMTVRFTTGGNFDNYTTVFYEITPASIADDVKVTGVKSSYTYAGKPVIIAPTLKYNGKTLKKGVDYAISYKGTTGVGKATMTITGKGNYAGSKSITYSITKGVQPLSVKASNKSIKHSKLKKKARSITALVVKGAKGKVTYANKSKKKVAKKIKVNAKTGKITVAKKTKKGTYKVKIQITSAGSANYKSCSKTVAFKIKVK